MPPLFPAISQGVVESYHHIGMIVLAGESLKMNWGNPFGMSDKKFQGLFSLVVIGRKNRQGPPWPLRTNSLWRRTPLMVLTRAVPVWDEE